MRLVAQDLIDRLQTRGCREGLSEPRIVLRESATPMDRATLDRTDERVVVDLATGIVASQSSEIEYMQGLLAGY